MGGTGKYDAESINQKERTDKESSLMWDVRKYS